MYLTGKKLVQRQFEGLRACLALLTKHEKTKLKILAIAQALLGLLDLAGVLVLGALGALAVRGIQSQTPGDRVYNLLTFFHLNSFSFQLQVAWIAVLAAFFLLTRTFLSMKLNSLSLTFLSHKAARISREIASFLLNAPLKKFQEKTSQEVVYLLSDGTELITTRVIGSLVAVFADAFTLVILTSGLILLDPLSTVLSTAIFAAVSGGMHFSLKNYLIRNSKSRTELLLKNANEVNEVVRTYREAYVRNTRYNYLETISKTREKLAHSNAQLAFIPNLSKYAMEVTVVFSLLGVCAIQFIFSDAANAVANLAIFLAAVTRIAPAVLRIQQGLTQIRSGLAEAEYTLSFIKEVAIFSPLQTPSLQNFDFNFIGFLPLVQVKNLTFQFPDEAQSIFANFNIEINQGETLAIFGSSGSGKSTLVDLILGLIPANSGSVKISGFPPEQAIAKWPGAIAYVPQEIEIISGTILDNLTLGFDKSTQNEKRAIEAIKIAQLYEFVSNLPLGIHTQVGNAGVRLSGGQKQRLGIARACYTKPKLLVLDEPTSSLDENTSIGFHKALAELRGTVSIIVIAHKIETAKFADIILHLNSNGPTLYANNLEFIKNYNLGGHS